MLSVPLLGGVWRVQYPVQPFPGRFNSACNPLTYVSHLAAFGYVRVVIERIRGEFFSTSTLRKG